MKKYLGIRKHFSSFPDEFGQSQEARNDHSAEQDDEHAAQIGQTQLSTVGRSTLRINRT